MLPRNAKIIAAYIQQVVSANLDRRNGLVRDWGTLEEEPYPCVRTTAEAISTALYYEKLHGRKELLNLARKLAKPVLRAMEIHGGAGWDGTIYLFDTQIALMALWRLIERTQEFAAWKGYFDVSDQSRLMAAQLTATHGAAVPDHWTARTTPHLLKIYPLLPKTEADSLRRLMELPSFTGVVNGHQSNIPLPTAQVCHAIEGLLVMPDGEYWQALNAAAFLARQQRADGSMPETLHDPEAASAADVTAQAVRIWTIVDRSGYDAAIRKAVDYLDESATPDGLPRYKDTERVCVRSSLYALQAVTMSESETAVDPDDLI